ncbi:lipoprotein signal peptidase [Marivirga harenae]|uniref:lipoprotein signal peptidase n=1 Tax=Marivirga harenae TaxID=2010992 RepID=UPI0026DF99E3|nr:lipoprotein signal peptidase [Marivirga harenae]WKV13028.1 lipoprotein signal peptidase [Marivirga harenae]
MKYTKYFLLTFFLIALDQVVKLWVHFNMEMGIAGQIEVFGEWFKLYYTLNPGMAFGMQFGSEYGKLGLTLFRLVAMFFIAYYLYKLAKDKTHPGVLWSMAAVLAGAIGNLIDSMFYGIWLDNAPYNAISPWFHGQVVDMFYIDIWEGRVAEWIPFWGGDYISLWPIFNVADAAIFCGVAVILIFQKKFFKAVKNDVAEG